jgi:large subunit ribosomal protein L10
MAKRAGQTKKSGVIKEFEDLIVEYPIIGSVNMISLPTKTVQKMRAQLRKKGVVLKMTKRRLISIAINNCKDKKPGVENLLPELKGMPALIFTKENPFALYKFLSKNKSSAPAKAGQIAPNDIVVKAGPTGFSPGPIIGELGAVGIKAGVDAGKIAIKADSVVAKSGDEITEQLAAILTRLGIEPMEIGLNMVAVFEEGNVYDSKILAIDEDEYIDNITKAATWALNLAVEAAIPTPDTTELLLQKCFKDSKAVAMEGNIMADAVTEELLAKAERQMLALKTEAKISDAPVEAKAEPAPAEEAKTEEKTETKPEEKTEATEEKKEEVKEESKPEAEEKPAEEPKTEEAPAEPVEEKAAEPAPAEEAKTTEKADEAKPVEEVKEEPETAPEEPVKEEPKPEAEKPADES